MQQSRSGSWRPLTRGSGDPARSTAWDHPDEAYHGRLRLATALLARRLLERGVYQSTLFNGAFAMGEGVLNWDGHRRILVRLHNHHGPILDQPAAALLADLKARGLLDDTLVALDHRSSAACPTFRKDRGPRP